MPKKTLIRIPMSLVSAFVNRHPYKSQDDAFVEILHKNTLLRKKVLSALENEDILYTPALARLGLAVPPDKSATTVFREQLARDDAIGDRAREILASAKPASSETLAKLRQKRPLVKDLVEAAAKQVRADPSHAALTLTTKVTSALEVDAIATAATATAAVTHAVDEATARLVERQVNKVWVMDRGAAREVTVPLPMNGHRIERQVWTGSIVQCPRAVVNLIGVADCVIDGRRVVEIKERKRFHFSRCPPYDIDQLCLYVVSLRAADGGTLTERAGDDVRHTDFTLEQLTTRYETEILPAINDAVDRFLEAVANPTDTGVWKGLRASERHPVTPGAGETSGDTRGKQTRVPSRCIVS
jgi:hypothetical protein